MKFHLARLVVMASTLSGALWLAGCREGNDASDSAAPVLTGTWTRTFNGSTVTITLGADGRYTVNMGGGTAVDVRGEYTVEDDQVTFADTGGNNASSSGEAIYRFVVRDGQLTLTPIDEPDENRESVAAATWTKS